MNSLSWMIYAADVLVRLISFFGVGAAVFLFAGGVSFLATAEPTNLNREEKMSVRKLGKKLFAFAACFAIIACFLPSKGTVYMIAASEAGEQVIKTPEAREMFESLRLRIMEELKVETK